MIKLIIATHNENKVEEIRSILKNRNIVLISLKDLCFKEDIVEDGLTFLENAKLKAKYISDKYHDFYVIADDSGLEVKSLNNEPGINSARYSGKGDKENNELLLHNLLNKKDRSASFVTSISLYYNGEELNDFTGTWEGIISEELKGEGGFGYDPLFIPLGESETVSELPIEYKNSNSHRAKALFKFRDYFLANIVKI